VPHGGRGGAGRAERGGEAVEPGQDELCVRVGHPLLRHGQEAQGHGPHRRHRAVRERRAGEEDRQPR